MVALACPQCKSTRLKRSHTRNFFERVAKNFNWREYRCIDCGWRGSFHVKTRKGLEGKTYTPGQIVLVAVVIILAIFALYYWLEREPERPSEVSETTQELVERGIC
jgi:predicted RNA-binding Zn-ribbon protein involved in translation (DUF1610 family)